MVERYNQSLIRMIGTCTSDDEQKENWNSYVTRLVHAYNATKHESIGYITFCWMFSRQPRLSYDAHSCLDNETIETSNNNDNCAKKHEQRLDVAYEIASREVPIVVFVMSTISIQKCASSIHIGHRV